MIERNANSTEIKELNKRKRETGELYLRRPEVDMQLASTISFDKKEIFVLLENKNKQSEGYLFDETLVYLLREAQIQRDNFTVETLYLELNRRIWKLLNKFYKNFDNHADFEDFGQKVELAVIKKIFDIESDSADYAQVNFGDFVITLAKVSWRGNLTKIKKEQETFNIERTDDDENKSEFQFESNELSTESKLILREGISKLPPNIRNVTALILDDWQIESKIESEPTISKVMNVSSRTIRNWLKEAREILAGYEGEVR